MNTTPDSHQICITFTDIIDSTTLWDRSEPTMWIAVSAHHRIIRGQLSRFAGYEVKSIGDAFFTCFTSARSALHFCLSVQNALARHAWDDAIVASQRANDRAAGYRAGCRPRGLIIRMGLHWGTPYKSIVDPTTERRDFYGTMVNESSRIQGQAEGDEIAISDAFLVELYRVQSCGEIISKSDLNDESRRIILEREMSVVNFKVVSKGNVKLRGLLGRTEHISIVSLLR